MLFQLLLTKVSNAICFRVYRKLITESTNAKGLYLQLYSLCTDPPPPLPSVKIGEKRFLLVLLSGGGVCTQAKNSPLLIVYVGYVLNYGNGHKTLQRQSTGISSRCKCPSWPCLSSVSFRAGPLSLLFFLIINFLPTPTAKEGTRGGL